MLSQAFRAQTDVAAETDQRLGGGGDSRGGGGEERCAIRICNQVQSKRVNLRGVCTLATKLAPCTSLVEILRSWRSCTIEMLPRSSESERERNRKGRVKGVRW